MASIFEVEERQNTQPHRRTALVALLLSPPPATMLKILIAICGVWTIFVAWAAISLIGFMTS